MSLNSMTVALDRYEADARAELDKLKQIQFAERFWQKDPTLWPGGPADQVAGMLGWVDILPKIEARLAEITAFVDDIKSSGFTRVVLAGMGGSSLAPYVLASCFPLVEGGLPITVLDSTDPVSVLRVQNEGPLDTTLFIISSKSGSTAEPTAFDAYFFDKVGKPENFVAITDPGSPFEIEAKASKYRHVFLNYSDIGGRFSALSLFGMIPAALMGLDVPRILSEATVMVTANLTTEGDAFWLGAILGRASLDHQNKLTILTTKSLASYGLWLEQLVAESTGKKERGILPVAGESLAAPAAYGQDRIFAYFRFAGDPEVNVEPLKAAGHPVITIDLADAYGIPQEFLRWEIATATVGHILDINPFDQPNVQESKDVTKKLLKVVEEEGKLPAVPGGIHESRMVIYGEDEADDFADAWFIFFGDAAPGDYVCIQAYLPESAALSAELTILQSTFRDELGLATTCGYGPRFLHSTGQYHKGGTNSGYFVQLTADHPMDAPIPGHVASWAVFIDAQAQGDLEALKAKGRRCIRVHFGIDPAAQIAELISTIKRGLARRPEGMDGR